MKHYGMFSKVMVLLLTFALVAAPLMSCTAAGGSISQIKDNELVIAALDGEGKVSGIQVLDHLRVLGEGSVQVTDKSAYKLKSARNLYGKEKARETEKKITGRLVTGVYPGL